PRQRHAKARPRLGVRHEVPNVDEPTDGGQDPQGDLEGLLHAWARAKSSRSFDTEPSERPRFSTTAKSPRRAATRILDTVSLACESSWSSWPRSRSERESGGW